MLILRIFEEESYKRRKSTEIRIFDEREVYFYRKNLLAFFFFFWNFRLHTIFHYFRVYTEFRKITNCDVEKEFTIERHRREKHKEGETKTPDIVLAN